MSALMTVRLKPNPIGKDRTRNGGASPTQLGAEWIDLRNNSTGSVALQNLELYHVAYSREFPNGRWMLVTGFSGSLPAGKVLRVHSGSGPISVLRTEDLNGADYHMFVNRNVYVWNNAEGDCAGLFMVGQAKPFDRACYAPNPPEGIELKRVNDSLVPDSQATTARTYR